MKAGLKQKIHERIIYLSEQEKQIKLSQNEISGLINYVHFGRRELIQKRDDPAIKKISDWILEKTRLAKDGNYRDDDIHSSFLQFVFLRNFPNFENFMVTTLSLEYKLKMEEDELTIVKKREGGRFGIILKVTKKTAKTRNFLCKKKTNLKILNSGQQSSLFMT